jgi:hypothetical protein
MTGKMVCRPRHFIFDSVRRFPRGCGCRCGTIADVCAGFGAQDLRRLDQLESLFDSIRSASTPVVDDIVRDIRTAHVGIKKDLAPVGPWEGREGELYISRFGAAHADNV